MPFPQLLVKADAGTKSGKANGITGRYKTTAMGDDDKSLPDGSAADVQADGSGSNRPYQTA